MVRMSSLPMHLRILDMFPRLTPMLRLRSHLKCSKPSERSCMPQASAFYFVQLLEVYKEHRVRLQQLAS